MPVGVRLTRVEVLGPLRLVVDDTELSLGSPKQQATVAILALNANTVVSKDTLIDGIWGEGVPGAAVGNLYTYLSNLRTIFAGTPFALARSSGGYRLDFDVDLLDVTRVIQLIERVEAAQDDPGIALGYAEEALAGWRSREVLTGVPGPFAAQRRIEFHRLRLRLAATQARLCIESERPEAAADQLRLELSHDPFDEQLAALLITALGRAGRRTEALAVFADHRQRLAAELGVAPGRDVQQAVERLTSVDDAVADGESGRMPHVFVGRAAEIDLVLAIASSARSHSERRAAPVVTVVGVGGIGKTAFAAECGRRLADQFADGQLTVDLQGFGPSAKPMTRHEALHALLSAMGEERIPSRYDARLARYRARLQTSHRLVVLDNVADHPDHADLADLVDVGTGNFVMVTSRDQSADLTGRLAHPIAHCIELTELSPLEARTLLAARIRRASPSSHRSQLIRLCRLCDNLPLALHIAAEQVNSRPESELAGLIDEFADATRRLDLLELDDRAATSVRAAFLWSYERLDADAARLLRLLASLPCDLFTASLAAAACDEPVPSATASIHDLVNHHLLDRVDGGVVMHDLTRACALEVAEHKDSASERDEAVLRAAWWYVGSLTNARQMLGVPGLPEAADSPRSTPRTFISPDDVSGWMRVNIRAVAALVPTAHKAGYPDVAWQLATLTSSYFYSSGRLTEWIDVLHNGLAAAEAAGSEYAQRRILDNLGVAYSRRGENDIAIRHYEQSLALIADDDPTRISVLCNLASTLREAKRYDAALRAALDALPVAERSGVQYARLGVLDALTEIYAETGEAELAVERAQQALSCVDTDALLAFEGNLLISLGTARRTLGDFGAARTALRRALTVTRGQRDHYHTALAEFGLARTELAAGNAEVARTLAQRAQQHFRELDAEEADVVDEFLAQVRRRM